MAKKVEKRWIRVQARLIICKMPNLYLAVYFVLTLVRFVEEKDLEMIDSSEREIQRF